MACLGSQVFHTCHNLATLTLPAKLTSIYAADGGTILQYSSLKEITVPESNNYMVVKDGILYNNYMVVKDGILYNKDMTVLMFVPSKMDHTNVVIPDTVTSIEDYALYDFSGTELDLPAGLVKIGAAAFRGCASLETVELGANLTFVGDFAFDGCFALAEVTFAEGCAIKELGSDATVESAIFRGTAALKSIALPETVRTIGANIFENSGLESITLPESLLAVSNYAFSGCASLTSVSIPEPSYAFYGCTSLKDVVFGEYLSVIGDYAFAECTGLEALDMSTTEVWIDGGNYPGKAEIGAFEGCNAIKKLSIGNIAPPPSGGFNGCPFRGWTSEQTIFFEYHTSAQRFNFIDLPNWGVFPGFTADWTKNHEAAIVFKDEV